METIEIYCNYGVLSAEKRNVYTYGAAHPHSTCCDKMTVRVPDDWKLCEGQTGQVMVESPWGWRYDINDVLSDRNGDPVFRALDKQGRRSTAALLEEGVKNE